ncbi:hypothetical protein JQK62_11800 [Leptospira santarosai]|nr:hypothetical protein [Leptospira santarosai]
MELFAVLAINAIVSVVLYYTITSKVTEKIRTHMLKRINEEIRDFVDELETESLRQVDLIGSRILTFKEMTFKVEELVKRIEQATTPDILSKIRLENSDVPSSNREDVNRFRETSSSDSSFVSESRSPEKNSPFSDVDEVDKPTLRNTNVSKIPGSVQQGIGHIYKENLDLVREEWETHTQPVPQNSYIQKNKITRAVQNQKPQTEQTKSKLESPATKINRQSQKPALSQGSNLVLETIGRGVRKFFGIQEIKTIRDDVDTIENDFFPGTRNSTLDISLDEDPFAPVPNSELGGTTSFKDNLKPADFGKILRDNVNGYKPINPDSARISAEAALFEIGEDSTKIEKVVFLLKRKYTHEEISEVLDLALGEVDIIERFRLDRNRRF